MGCHGGGLTSIFDLSAISSHPGLAAEAAAVHKRSKYAAIMLTHIFVPVVVETLGHVNAEGLRLPDQIVVFLISENVCTHSLFQHDCLSRLLHLRHGHRSLATPDTDFIFSFFSFFFNAWDPYY